MGLQDLRNKLRFNPPILPDALWLTYNSIARAAANAAAPPFVKQEDAAAMFQAWVNELDQYTSAIGRFDRFAVLYVPFSPPPLFWDYKCKKCRWWGPSNGLPDRTCKLVAGNISSGGWCAIWCPPDGYRAFTWPSELIKEDW